MDIVFGFLAGALTLLNPCVLPVLPIVLASSLGADKRGPLFLTAGMAASFVAIGLVLPPPTSPRAPARSARPSALRPKPSPRPPRSCWSDLAW